MIIQQFTNAIHRRLTYIRGSYLIHLFGVRFFTLDRQNYNQVSENSCAEAVPSTPPSEVVWSE